MKTNVQRPITPEKHKHKHKRINMKQYSLKKVPEEPNTTIDRNDKQTRIQYSCIS